MYENNVSFYNISDGAKMSWTAVVVIATAVAAGNAINRPVYKIELTQKGFAQVTLYTISTSRGTQGDL